MSFDNKENIVRSRASTWAYVGWLTFGGFISLTVTFFIGVILTISIIGCGMATQAFRLGNYLLGGADEVYSPEFADDKVRNTIWMILGGWFLYIFHMGMGYLFKFTYIGRNAATIWFETAKIVAFPYGVDLEPKGVN